MVTCRLHYFYSLVSCLNMRRLISIFFLLASFGPTALAQGYGEQVEPHGNVSPLTLGANHTPVPVNMMYAGDPLTTLKSVYLSSVERPAKADQENRFTAWFIVIGD
jgi:hypothetical protein